MRLFPAIPILFLVVSCTTAPLPEHRTVVPAPIEKREAPEAPEPAPAVAVERILLRDPATGTTCSLAALAEGRPIVVDLSASWCEPCGELVSRLEAVSERFGDRVRFVMALQKGDAPERLAVRPRYPVYLIEAAPAELGVVPPPVIPTVLMFGSDGELKTELAGLYPALAYYGAVADLFPGE